MILKTVKLIILFYFILNCLGNIKITSDYKSFLILIYKNLISVFYMFTKSKFNSNT